MAFDSIEPISVSQQLESLKPRLDYNIANVVKTLINMFGRKKGQQPISLEDCTLNWDGKQRGSRRQTPEQMIAVLKSCAPGKGKRKR